MSRPAINTIRQRFGLGDVPKRIGDDTPPCSRPGPTLITLPGGHQAMTITVCGFATAIEHNALRDTNEIIVVLYDSPALSFVPCYRMTAEQARGVGASLIKLADGIEADAMAQANAALLRANGGL